MSDDRSSQTGVEIALAGVQEGVREFTTRLDNGLKDVRNDIRDQRKQLDEHAREERDWQREIDAKLALLAPLPAKVSEMDVQLQLHERALNQGRGVIVASKAIWAVLGAGVAAVVWLLSHNVTVQTRQPAPAAPSVVTSSSP